MTNVAQTIARAMNIWKENSENKNLKGTRENRWWTDDEPMMNTEMMNDAGRGFLRELQGLSTQEPGMMNTRVMNEWWTGDDPMLAMVCSVVFGSCCARA